MENPLKEISYKKIPLTELVLGRSNVRQDNLDRNIDELAYHIKKCGLIQPIVVCKNDSVKYEIILGQRRYKAYLKLDKEHPGEGFDKIICMIVKKILNDYEKKMIAFSESTSRLPMQTKDYIDVIHHFYAKHRSIKDTADALGITTSMVRKYLTTARLSDKVKKCIENKEFTIDIAMKSLSALGDDESVDDDAIIELARELDKVTPAKRKQVVKKMQTLGVGIKEAVKDSVPTREIRIHLTADLVEKLEAYKKKHSYHNENEALARMLVELLDNES